MSLYYVIMSLYYSNYLQLWWCYWSHSEPTKSSYSRRHSTITASVLIPSWRCLRHRTGCQYGCSTGTIRNYLVFLLVSWSDCAMIISTSLRGFVPTAGCYWLPGSQAWVPVPHTLITSACISWPLMWPGLRSTSVFTGHIVPTSCFWYQDGTSYSHILIGHRPLLDILYHWDGSVKFHYPYNIHENMSCDDVGICSGPGITTYLPISNAFYSL